MWIEDVIRQAYVEVHEMRTEAAAATAAALAGGIPAEPPRFVANRPFLLLIRDNLRGAILSLGRVVDPREWVQRLSAR